MNLVIINGPNLNLTGRRETDIYGSCTFEDYLEVLRRNYSQHDIKYLQSNCEGCIIDYLQAEGFTADGIILNAGGYTHTSVAIADAIRAITTPVIEVHLSNIYAREAYRHTSMIASVCRGSISGFGLNSYRLAIESLIYDTH